MTRTFREGTKQAALIVMLRAPDGATIEEIATALEWRSHTIRGAIAGALKKKLGLTITSETVEERGRIYKPCLSGYYPHPLNVGWVHSPE